MKSLILAGLLIVLSSIGVPVNAKDMAANGFVIENAWSRATVPGARAAAVYMVLNNGGEEPATVASLSSDVAKMTEAHQTINEGGMTRMRPAENLTVAPGGLLAFEPGGLHVMLMGLERQLAEGDSFTLRITMADGQQLETEVVVGAPGQMSMP